MGKNENSSNQKVRNPIITLIVLATLLLITLVLFFVGVKWALAGTFFLGIVDFIEAAGLRDRAKALKRFICPECGTEREHHRMFAFETKSIKRLKRDTTKDPNYDAREIIKFTQTYENTYTCPNCGCSYKDHTKESGGNYTVYYSGREENNRVPPEEF